MLFLVGRHPERGRWSRARVLCAFIGAKRRLLNRAAADGTASSIPPGRLHLLDWAIPAVQTALACGFVLEPYIPLQRGTSIVRSGVAFTPRPGSCTAMGIDPRRNPKLARRVSRLLELGRIRLPQTAACGWGGR